MTNPEPKTVLKAEARKADVPFGKALGLMILAHSKKEDKMKRILVFLLTLTAVFAFSGAGLAEAKVRGVATRTFTGTVAWVDPIRNSIVLKGTDEDLVFRVATYAKLKRRGRVVGLAKFVRGDRITITYKVERKIKIATVIY